MTKTFLKVDPTDADDVKAKAKQMFTALKTDAARSKVVDATNRQAGRKPRKA